MPGTSAQRAWRDPQREGAGNAGCPMHPQPRALMVVKIAHEYSQRVHRNRPAFPHAMVLRLTSCSPRRSALLPPSPRGFKVLPSPVEPNEPPQDLTPASRRQDHTTSPYAATRLRQKASPGFGAIRLACRRSLTESNPPCDPIARLDAAASTASRPASVTIAIRPSCGARRLWIGR
jgi:hypothetical protein